MLRDNVDQNVVKNMVTTCSVAVCKAVSTQKSFGHLAYHLATYHKKAQQPPKQASSDEEGAEEEG